MSTSKNCICTNTLSNDEPILRLRREFDAANDAKGFSPIETSTGQRWITPSDNELHFTSRRLIPPKRLLPGSSAWTPCANSPSATVQNPLKVNKPSIEGIITAVRMGASLARKNQSAAPGQIKPTPKQRRAML